MRFLALLSILLCALVPATQAADEAVLAAATAQHLAVYQIVRDFHAQTLLAGDPVRTAELKQLITAQDQLRNTLLQPSGNATADAALKRVAAEWPAFRKTALGNNFSADGYTDYNLVADLTSSAAQLDKALGEATSALQTNKDSLAVHQANVLLLQIAAGYIKRTAQASPEVGGSDDFDVANATKQLDTDLQSLQKRLSKHPEALQLLQEALRKWSFIKPRLIDYNQSTVPYIVDRHTRQISDTLSKVAALL